MFVFRGHEGTVFQSFDKHEIDDSGSGYTSEEGNAVFHLFRIVESEYHTGKPLYKHSEEEGDSDGDEDRHDDGEGFVGVYEVAQTEGIAIMYFDKWEGKGTSE